MNNLQKIKKMVLIALGFDIVGKYFKDPDDVEDVLKSFAQEQEGK